MSFQESRPVPGRRASGIPSAGLIFLCILFSLPGSSPGYAQAPSLNLVHFELPRVLVAENSSYPELRKVGDQILLVYQRLIPSQGGGRIRVEAMWSDSGRTWSGAQTLGPEVPFLGESAPPIFSVSNRDGEALVVIAEESGLLRFYRAAQGSSFAPVSLFEGSQSLASPRLSAWPGGYLLFASRELGGQPQIHFSSSPDGNSWTPLQPLPGTAVSSPSLSFNPSHVYVNGLHVVVYQAVQTSVSSYFQLFMQTSLDGRTWSQARWISSLADELDLNLVAEAYDNQRPALSRIDEAVYLAWERRAQGRNVQIYGTRLDPFQGILNFPTPISNRNIAAGYPKVYDFNSQALVMYFDNPGGNSRMIAALDLPLSVQTRVVSTDSSVHTFGSALVDGDKLHLIWQNKSSPQAAGSRIVYREPDQSVGLPLVRALNFQPGLRSNQAEVRFLIEPPSDPSGIRGFAFSWSQDPGLEPDRQSIIPLGDMSITLPASRDGEWEFAVSVLDGAGNWSAASRLSYFLDNTPPDPVTYRFPRLDEAGYLTSNSFELEWLASQDLDLAGYAVNLSYLGPENMELPQEPQPLPPGFGARIQPGTTTSGQNLDNGLWVLSVSAVDRVGNLGQANQLYFRLNKYIPVTRVSSTSARTNILGDIELSLNGRGFRANGFVEELIIDRDGIEPWDYQLIRDKDFRIVGDSRIEGVVLRNIRSGDYRLRLYHSERGWYQAPGILGLEDGGTVRYGDYTIYEPYRFELYRPSGIWALLDKPLAMWATLILLLAAAIAASLRIRLILRDSIILRAKARALILGEAAPQSRKRRYTDMRRQGIGLGIKFTALIVVLVVSVVAMISLPLRAYFLSNQQESLARGLEERVSVLIESIASGAENILPSVQAQTIDLAQLILQAQVMEEAEFVSITAPAPQTGAGVDYVWASTDPLLLSASAPPNELDTRNREYFQRSIPGDYLPGLYQLKDSLSESIPELADSVNSRAREEVGDIPDRLDALLAEAVTLVLDTSAEGIIRRREIDSTIRGLNDRLDQILRGIAGEVRSIPEFDSSSYDPSLGYYLFYQPVLYRGRGSSSAQDSYYQGMVRMGVSTSTINERIDDTARSIQNNIVIFSLIAVLSGIAGAALLSLITIMPIRQLVRAVELIRDTEDKSTLADLKIPVRSRDELFVLSEVIQQMTLGLARAAEANKELLFGKDVQKMFISLDVGPGNVKATTGHQISEHSEFFGYYEGAKGVSGDYFYYQKISPDTFAIIKCDVAGKGISAALIMVEVATLFLNFFNDWEAKQIRRLRLSRLLKEEAQHQPLTELVYNINDLIAERQFAGKFAALNIALFNEKSGEILFCNAGDNQIFIFRKEKQALIQSTLFRSPASGMFNSKDMPIEFREEKEHLHSGDVLLLFTDGLEESKRTYRDSEGEPYLLRQEDLDQGRVPEDYIVDSASEEMGLERLHQIINAVENRRIFRLKKYFAPWEPEDLLFDFSGLRSSPENTVLALVAVEKIFRLNPDPKAGPEQRISIDRKIDDFLRQTFQQYMHYFHSPLPEQADSLYRSYSGVREDEQYDDLTILAVKKA